MSNAVRFTKSNILVALVDISGTCLFHLRSLVVVMLRSFWLDDCRTGVCDSVYCVIIGWAILEKCMTIHLVWFKSILQSLHQLAILSRSCCRIMVSWKFRRWRWHFVSSANIVTVVSCEVDLGMRKRSGPRIDPWGTPESTGSGSDVTPRTVTLCNRPER